MLLLNSSCNFRLGGVLFMSFFNCVCVMSREIRCAKSRTKTVTNSKPSAMRKGIMSKLVGLWSILEAADQPPWQPQRTFGKFTSKFNAIRSIWWDKWQESLISANSASVTSKKLKLNIYTIARAHHLTESIKLKRTQKCHWMLLLLAGGCLSKRLFTNDNVFTA